MSNVNVIWKHHRKPLITPLEVTMTLHNQNTVPAMESTYYVFTEI